jgi:hypothetical protein
LEGADVGKYLAFSIGPMDSHPTCGEHGLKLCIVSKKRTKVQTEKPSHRELIDICFDQ